MTEHAPGNAMTDADEIARFHDRASDLMRALLGALASRPDEPRPFAEIERGLGWPPRRIASVLGGVARVRMLEFGGRRPYRLRDERQAASGRWELWMDGRQAAAVRAARRDEARGPIFDAHVHIVDPRFPLAADAGYEPAPFTVADYRRRVAGLDIVGGAVVSGSFQGADHTYLVDALARLGPGWAGVTQLPVSASDADVRALDRAGVRAVRFNLRRGGSAPLDQLETLARRVFALAGWHVELYVDGRELPALESRLAALPRVSIDHLGLRRDGLPALLRLVERGARVKATGFGRVDLDVSATLRAIADVDPAALLFGTDLPSTRAPRPFADADVRTVVDALGPALAARALHDNAIAWYRPPR